MSEALIPGYRGRFAPSPTGPLHAGSLVAALASWLDARAHGGRWLVRMEDVDQQRCRPGMDRLILQQLSACGLEPDEPPVWQSQRTHLYQAALDRLISAGLSYPCGCSRASVAAALAAQGRAHPGQGELVYPGTCRHGLNGKPARAWRLRTSAEPVQWFDRRLGWQHQSVEEAVGDFILKRADAAFAYQLAVVVDDAEQGISDVVRGADLTDNTARQILLQQALGLQRPGYLHVPLKLGSNGEKLSKQNGAVALDTGDPLAVLNDAAALLGLTTLQKPIGQALARWTGQWRQLHDNQPHD